MSKEELHDQGWDITFSGTSPVPRWGKYMVCVRHANKGSAHGYGNDEQQALNDIADMLSKRTEDKNVNAH